MSARFDVVIAGGGPAGAAAALSILDRSPGIQLAIVEPRDRGRSPIGETLDPAALPILKRLRLLDVVRAQGHLGAVGTATAWGSAGLSEADFLLRAQGEGLHLERRRFDALLLGTAVERGATRVEAHVARVVRQGEGFSVTLDQGAPITAGFLVDATGRRARVARGLGAERVRFDDLVAIVRFYDAPEVRDARTHVVSVEDGWWYATRIPGGGVVIAFCTDGDHARALGIRRPDRFEERMAPALRTWRGPVDPRGGVTVFPADSSALVPFAGPAWMAVGDAALAFDPLSGQGLAKALAHGQLAAFAVADHLSGSPDVSARLQVHLRGELEGYLGARETIYREEMRFPESRFWRRRQVALTLTPTAVLRPTGARLSREAALAAGLCESDRGRLLALLADGRPAHTVVAAARGVLRVPDRRTILALQALIAGGAIRPD